MTNPGSSYIIDIYTTYIIRCQTSVFPRLIDNICYFFISFIINKQTFMISSNPYLANLILSNCNYITLSLNFRFQFYQFPTLSLIFSIKYLFIFTIIDPQSIMVIYVDPGTTYLVFSKNSRQFYWRLNT